MCGLLTVDKAGLTAEAAGSALAQLSHRGPDHSALVRLSDRMWMGHARLSILDLNPRSHQPMRFDGVSLVFNGEIYNFESLRKELEAQGVRFATTSDTEVLLKLYHRDGPSFVSKLEGMFAFVLHDARTNTLFFARDRFGIKPLYRFERGGGGIILSSEIKPVLALEPEARRLDMAALVAMIGTNFVFGPRTLFEGVAPVEPGVLFARNAEGQTKEIVRFDSTRSEPFRGDETQAERAFAERLERAVVSHLVSDVPVGIFLSGGLDSGVIAHYLAKHAKRPVRSYSFSNRGTASGDDESAMAERLANTLGFSHENVEIDMQTSFPTLYEKAMLHSEMPIPYPAAVPLFALAERAGKSTRVVLTGDGGDEILAGYNKYLIANDARARWTLGLQSIIGGRSSAWSRLALAQSTYLPGFRDYFSGSSTDVDLGEAKNLMRSFALGAQVDKSAVDLLGWLLHFDQQNYLRGMLHKTDTMTMAHSIEARVPFLDNQLAAFANALPSNLKLRGREKKYLLRRVAAKILPSEYMSAPKRGFPVSAIELLVRADARRIVDAFVTHEAVKEILVSRRLSEFRARLESPHVDYMTLWIMMCFVDWHRMFFVEKPFLRAPTPPRSVSLNEVPV